MLEGVEGLQQRQRDCGIQKGTSLLTEASLRWALPMQKHCDATHMTRYLSLHFRLRILLAFLE